METLSIKYEIERVLEYAPVTEDISIAHISELHSDTKNKINDIFCYVKSDNISNVLHSFNDYIDKNFNHILFMHKSFIDAYSKSSEPNNLDKFIRNYGITIEQHWDLVNKNEDVSNYIPVELSYYDNTIYPFTYGKSRDGWFAHMVAYSIPSCYMVTNKDYDLSALATFLKEMEDSGEVCICRGHDDEIIQNIPYYNQDVNECTKYINFLCKVCTSEEYKLMRNGSWLHINPKYEKLIEQFKLN